MSCQLTDAAPRRRLATGLPRLHHGVRRIAADYGLLAAVFAGWHVASTPGWLDPAVLVGLRLSATTALLLLIAAEMIAANGGVGFQVMNAQYNFQIPMMFAAIFLLAAFGLGVNAVLVWLQRHLCCWSAPDS